MDGFVDSADAIEVGEGVDASGSTAVVQSFSHSRSLPTSGPSVTVTFQSKEGANKAQLVVTTLAADATPPTTPANLSGTIKSDTEIDLSWSASTVDLGPCYTAPVLHRPRMIACRT